MKLLVVTPNINKIGGVSNHYLGLSKHLPNNTIYLYISQNKGFGFIIYLLYDYLKFAVLVLIKRPTTIILNPSLQRNAIFRDAVFLIIGKMLFKKVVVFIHGWNNKFEKKISKNPFIFRLIFEKANLILTLSTQFVNTLQSWGLKTVIERTTTKVDNDLVERFVFSEKRGVKRILFLARLEKEKGVDIAIKAVKALKLDDVDLIIGGVGKEYSRLVEKYKNDTQIKFMGYITGDKVKKAFIDSDIYILPTYHGEGMPTSILEAMAFGLPIITRPVGGIVDFFINNKMGFLVESMEYLEFSEKLKLLINNVELLNQIGHYNFNYAKQNFYADKVSEKLLNLVLKYAS